MAELLSTSIWFGIISFGMVLLLPALKNYCSAKWRAVIWIFIAVRLLIPFNLTAPSVKPIEVTLPNPSVVISQAPIVIEQAQGVTQHIVKSYIDLAGLLPIIWIAGMVVFLAYHWLMYLIFISSLKSNRCEHENPMLDDFLVSMGIKRHIKLYVSKSVNSPVLLGIFKSCIYTPQEDYPESEMFVILKHELIHYKKKDLIYKALMLITNAVHWFNPFVYAMVRQANHDLELVCDDLVVKNEDMKYRKEYSTAILNAVQNQLGAAVSTNLNGGAKTMKKRLANILDVNAQKRGVTMIIISAVVLSMGSFVAVGSTAEMFGNIIKTDFPLDKVVMDSVYPAEQEERPEKVVMDDVESSMQEAPLDKVAMDNVYASQSSNITPAPTPFTKSASTPMPTPTPASNVGSDKVVMGVALPTHDAAPTPSAELDKVPIGEIFEQ